MKFLRLITTLLLVIAPPLWANDCELIGVTETDGTGAPDRYRVGGSFVAVEIDKLIPGSELVVHLRWGDLSYLTLHERSSAGNWQTAYQGQQMRFAASSPVVNACRLSSDCTHLVVSLNGAHEKYESVNSSAYVQICGAGSAPTQPPEKVENHDEGPSKYTDTMLDKTWYAIRSGWQLSYPSDWHAEVSDDPNGGTGMFTSPDEDTVVGISTFQLPEATSLESFANIVQAEMFTDAVQLSQTTVKMDELDGLVRRYDFSSGGQPYAVFAGYLERGNHVYVLWAVAPKQLEDERFPLAVDILNSFAQLPLETTLQPALVKPNLVVLVVNTTQQKPVPSAVSRFVIPPAAGEIFFDSLVVGSNLTGTISWRLSHVTSGRVLWENAETVQAQANQTQLTANQSVTPPASGWVEGPHLVSVYWNGEYLGGQMFRVGEAQ